MILVRKGKRSGTVKITFSVPDDGRPVSVVGDFNAWDPLANPLRRRSNGTRSAAVEVPAGTPLVFRYLYDGGEWGDEPDAEVHPNGLGGTHSVLVA